MEVVRVPSPSVARLLLATVALGAAAGGTVSLLAFLVARYGPSGGSWSFRGNGALAVYPLFLAVLAGGWTALALRGRGRRGWFGLGAAALGIGALLVLLDAAVLPVLGTSALTEPLTLVLLLAAIAWTAAAPLWAALSPAGGPGATEGASHLLAAGAWLLAAAAGLVAVGVLIPAGS